MSALLPLRPTQLGAADPERHAWVSASAGTGKTQVLTARVLRLLLAGAAPERILCLTFTKAAAAEMQTRIYARLARWVRVDDAGLAADLEALGAPADPETRENARRLFARTLDARGGLRIQTLHAFAQGLLASFPVEAGVAPGFSALDDRTALELRARVLAETLTEAEGQGDLGFVRDVGDLAVRLGEMKLSKLAGTLISYRDAIAALGAPQGFEALLRSRLGLPREGTLDELMARALSDTAFEVDGLRVFARACAAWGTKTGLAHADVIHGWLACDGAGRCAGFAELRKVFYKSDGTVRVFGDKLLQQAPGLEATIEAIADAIEGVRLMEVAFDLAAYAALHLRVGHRLATAYQRHKDRAGALDFDDMIVRAAHLLTQDGMADWVRFKLDQGLDHILVDEGQDTNFAQWQIIHALADEFFSGRGAREEVQRTLFAVGDFKQAIFSFQGSDPQVFQDYRQTFRDLAADAQRPLADVPLDESFRSTEAVLAVVDRVLADLGHQALGMPEAPAPHVAARKGLAGRVTLWPPVLDPRHGGDEAEATETDWIATTEIRMAQQLARQIRGWLDEPLMLEAKGRAVRPEDILVLVRSRREFVGALVGALHAERVPVAGVDRLRLTEPLAVQDLLALVRFALQPEDDLTLATLLVSPFIGWPQGGADDPLFALAAGRDDQPLWRRLRQRAAGGDARAKAAADWLQAVLAIADLKPPHEFFETVLSGRHEGLAFEGRRRLLARLGEEARDSIEAVLAQALAFEASHAPSLQGFLAWIEADEVEMKRDPDAPLDAVRIMTVHGAKGLQAPVVILADTARTPKPQGDDHAVLHWGPNDEPIPVFYGSKERRIGRVADKADEAERRAREEHWRLLYVALTRAEDMLFVGGSLGAREVAPGPDSWHAAVRGALERLGAATIEDPIWGETLVHAGGAPAPAAAPKTAAAHDAPPPLPAWALAPPAQEPAPPRPLTPSQLAQDDVASPPPSVSQMKAAKQGQLLHKLFERLPAVSPERRLEAASAWLARQAPDIDAAERDRLAYQALAVIDDPGFAELFSPAALAEAPIAAVVDGAVVAGTVDRLLIAEDRVQVVDFKTGRMVPQDAGEVSGYHLKQMAAYAAALARIFPGRRIEAALLFTEQARLIAIPDDLLAANAPAVAVRGLTPLPAREG